MSRTKRHDVFKFPVRKFDDRIGLFKNFRYMEDFFETLANAGSRSATFVIASRTTSSSQSLDGADYFCSGVNDEVQVQAALDAMPSDGGSLYFAEGQYEMSGSVTLPAKDIVMYGSGTLNFTGATTAFENAFNGTENGNYAFTGLIMTGALRNASQTTRGAKLMTGGGTSGGTRWTVTGCKFITLSANIFFGTKDISQTSEFIVTGNYFEAIELRRGVNASDDSLIIGKTEGGSRSGFGMFAGNYLDGLTTNNGGGSNDSYYIAISAEDDVYVSANVFKGVSGLTANFGGTAVGAHNVINGTMVGGDHTGVDHGLLSGLADDDHTQYLLDEASGGAASEIPDHTHASGAEAGTVAHSALTGVTSDLHHAQAHTVASHSDTTGTGAELETLTDGSATALHKHDHGGQDGLGDDDHSQYPLKSIFTTAGDIWYATGSSTPVRLGIGAASTVLATNSGATAPEWVDNPPSFPTIFMLGGM